MASRSANPRLAALALLSDVLDRGHNLSESRGDTALDDARDRAFARHLTYGTLRWLGALEYLAEGLLKRPLKRRDRDIGRLLCIGLFQLWKDSGADHAAINEAAECARLLGKPWAVGLVNAVLRRFQRERDKRLKALNGSDSRYAHPDWLLDRLQADWPDDWRNIVAANNRPGPLWLRLNVRADPNVAREELRGAGFDLQDHPAVATAVRLTPASAVDALPGFAEGRFSVQDPAAQLAAEWLETEPGHRVLDACAAPGGKTGHLLERCGDIELTALDRSPERLERVRENLDRLGFNEGEKLRLRAADATEVESWWDGRRFDRILLDAPCTATGVIRRHPEIKWLRTPGQVDQAAVLQARLLLRLWPLLRPGGILLYATCSLLDSENGSRVNGFLEQHPNARAERIEAAPCRQVGPGVQILPGELEMDGFYYARIRKQP
jgi:16S rRNA (cytosine967-C5)-methyltransferase